MTNAWIKHLIGLAAAATTTLVIFSSVAGLAEDDRKALAAARVAPAQIAAVADSQPR